MPPVFFFFQIEPSHSPKFEWPDDTFNSKYTEPVFLNVYGAQESIPRNEFRQPMQPGGPVRYPIHPWFLAPIDSLKIPALGKIIGTLIREPNPLQLLPFTSTPRARTLPRGGQTP